MATGGAAGSSPLARRVREEFVAAAEVALVPMSQALLGRLHELSAVTSTSTGAERQARQAALKVFDGARVSWVQGTEKAWRAATRAVAGPASSTRPGGTLELIGDDVVEQTILASRLALSIGEKATWEINDLRRRMEHLEGGAELSPDDVLRPETVARLLVDQWMTAGLTREHWLLVQDLIRQHMVDGLLVAYQRSNRLLVAEGVLPEIDLSGRVRRSGDSRLRPASGPGGVHCAPATTETVPAPQPAVDRPAGARARGVATPPGEAPRPAARTTLLARARLGASGVLGQIRQLLAERLPGFNPDLGPHPSPGLLAALADDATLPQGQAGTRPDPEDGFFDTVAVAQIAGDLRQRADQIKRRAGAPSEKAIIEVVALMFQSILAEDRIPAAVRVWFARLQMPVLRVAIAEPAFFGSTEHPARLLIDRMGSCVMGFEAGLVGGSALHAQIKRAVQVIEQYPETGGRVFQLAYDEFQAFLASHLTEREATQRAMSVAQQVELKETMAIQYTIEMRHTLDDIPVREAVRDFLFKVWSEVLAVAAVKSGAQHPDTLGLKKAAAELVWAASAKPGREDRARVIAQLPGLLQRLRGGMSLLGLPGPAQEAHIKVLGDTLADAFMSKTEAISPARVDALSARLAHLEDFFEDTDADLRLDSSGIEMMLGIDASMIEVVSEGGAQATTEPQRARARELQLGSWLTLAYRGRDSQVQYVWRSERGQFHLLAMPDGKSFLMQAHRLAAYLQAALLRPIEEEALSVRAAREALNQLGADPGKLLA